MELSRRCQHFTVGHLFIFILNLNAAVASETGISTRLSLFFPIEKNNIQILPQRFEYELLDKDQFRIGNVIFDARMFNFEVTLDGPRKYKYSLQWPAGLLTSGEISIRDNIGKAIWIQAFDRNKVKFSRLQPEPVNTGAPTTTGAPALGPGSLVAKLEAQEFPTKIFNALRYVPYFRLCVQKADLPTRVSLCSKDFYIHPSKNTFEVESRDSLRKESFVNINGNNVGGTGLVFLQGLDDPISLRVLLLSGSTIDVDTRLKKVDFRDLSVSDDGKRLQIWAAGAEPTINQKIQRLEDSSWRSEINLERPTIYLKGEGDIPMRQEFVTKGVVRDKKFTIDSPYDIPRASYNSSITIPLRKIPGLVYSPGDANSTLTNDTPETVDWTLSDLTDFTRNRRHLNVATPEQKFVAAWDVDKYPPWELNVGAFVPVAGKLQMVRWFNNRHLGLGVDFKYTSTPYRSIDGNSSRTRGQIYWSWSRFSQFVDTGWGLHLFPEQRQWGNTTSSGGVAGLFYKAPVTFWPEVLGQWMSAETDLTSTAKVPGYSNAMGIRTDFYHRLSQSQYWHWGLEYGSLVLDDLNGSSTLSRLEASLGFSYLF